jgi:hypothetical protein
MVIAWELSEFPRFSPKIDRVLTGHFSKRTKDLRSPAVKNYWPHKFKLPQCLAARGRMLLGPTDVPVNHIKLSELCLPKKQENFVIPGLLNEAKKWYLGNYG